MKPNDPRPRSYLWLIFVAAFALQIAAWTAWFIVAAHHPVAEVPLATSPRR
ncbi:MAG: hypothetical protein ABI222_03965 [Opitutaceae bacterium]